MFNIEKAHFIIDEMVMSGYIVETNKANILNPVLAIVKAAGPWTTRLRPTSKEEGCGWGQQTAVYSFELNELHKHTSQAHTVGNTKRVG